MKRVEYVFFTIAFVATIGALIIIVVNEATFGISQVLLTLALVLITCIYAIRTSDIAKATAKQADASVKMAEEMRKQRYDTVRPVIDLQWLAETNERRLREAASSPSQLASEGCSCVLPNVGLGPAIDVYSFVPSNSGERHRYDFGTIATPRIGGEPQILFSIILSPKQEGGRVVIQIYYKDVYGREFESSREIVGKQGDWKLGPLQIRLVEEGENKP